MLRENVVQALTELTVSSFILLAVGGVSGTQAPMRIAESAMYQLSAAGRNVGADIITNALGAGNPNVALDKIKSDISSRQVTSPSSYTPSKPLIDANDLTAEPTVYWLSWIGVKNANTAANSTQDAIVQKETGPMTDISKEYKFSYASLMNRFWGIYDISKTMQHSAGDKSQLADAAAKAATDVAVGVFTATNPMRLVGQAMMVATIQTGAILTPAMQQIGVFIGALMSFYVVAALGIATLPLIYFKSFRDLWRTYLTVLAGIALVPCFYYIFSAIGFVFAANAYEGLFPFNTGPAPQGSFAQVINTVYMNTMAVTLCIGSNALGPFGKFIDLLAGMMFEWSLLLGRILFASGVVAAVIAGGVSFAMMGGQIAYRWAQGFGAENMTDKVGEFFTGIQGATGSGLSAMYSRSLSSGAEMLGGMSRGLGGG